MALSWYEKLVVKLGWGRLNSMFPILKRYLPLIGVAFFVATVALRFAGQNEAADTLLGVGGAIGANDASPVSLAELTAAVTAGAGVVLKVISEVKKILNPPPQA